MSEFGSSIQIEASADKVFQYACDPRNMPRYLPTVEEAEWQGAGRVFMRGNSHGHEYRSDGWFDLDPANLTMSWGSDGETVYSGTMTVIELDRHQCKATVSLNYRPSNGGEAQFEDSRRGMIQQGLDRAMHCLKQLCEELEVSEPADPRSGRRYMS